MSKIIVLGYWTSRATFFDCQMSCSLFVFAGDLMENRNEKSLKQVFVLFFGEEGKKSVERKQWDEIFFPICMSSRINYRICKTFQRCNKSKRHPRGKSSILHHLWEYLNLQGFLRILGRNDVDRFTHFRCDALRLWSLLNWKERFIAIYHVLVPLNRK